MNKALQSSSDPDWRIILTPKQIEAITPAAPNKKKPTRREESQSNRISVLHHFAKEFPVNADSFVKWLIQTHPFSTHLKTTEALYSNYTPFLLALQQQNDRFVKAAIDHQSKEKLAILLKPANTTLDVENCLHLAIDMESQYTLDIIETCQILDCTMFQQGDKQQSKNIPLHCAVIHTPEDPNDKEKQRLVVGHLIKACHSVLLIPNGNGDTPYQARIRALKEQIDENSFRDERNLGSGPETGAPDSTQNDLDTNDASSVRSNTSVSQTNEAGNSAYEDGNYEDNPTDGKESDQDLANRFEDLSFEENKGFRQIIIDDPILSLIRDYYIRNLSNADIASALYHATQGTCAHKISVLTE